MLLSLDSVTVSYSSAGKVLDRLDLDTPEGEFIGIAGRSGSGKTTLLETLGGVRVPGSGRVLFHGRDIHGKNFDRLAFRRQLQIVFQFPENLFFENDVRSEAAFGPRMLGIPEEQAAGLVNQALSAVGLTDEKITGLSPFTLSGGQKRRLAIACALAVSPQILLLDEPFSGMDGEGCELLSETLRKLHSEGMTIMMASHDPDTLYELADRLIILSDGRISANGSPSAVYGNRELCEELEIPRPEIIKVCEKTGLDTARVNSYAQFIDVLRNHLCGREE